MSRIVESLYEKYELEEDFWNPGGEFQEFQDMYEVEPDKWNSWNQEQRDAFAEKMAKKYLKINPHPSDEFFDDLEDSNFHTEYKAFKKLLGESLKESKQKLNEGLDYYMNEIDIVIAEWKAVKRHISNNEYDKAKRVLEDLVDSGMLAEDILSKI